MTEESTESKVQKLKRLLRYNQTFSAYWLLLPFIIMTLIFKGWPVLWAPWMAMQEYTLVSTTFTGFDNYASLFTRGSFLQSLKVTLIIGTIRLPLAIGIGLLAAVTVNSVFIRHRTIWRTLFIAPIVVAPVVVAIIVRMFLEPQGIVDLFTNTLFGTQIAWLNSPVPAQISVALAGAYVDIAICFIFFLAGLVGIDYDLYRAARVDGANRIQQFRYVTIPQLRPIIVLVLIFMTNRALKMFAEPMVLTDGGQPGGATRTVVVLLYQQAFTELNLGFAAAIGVALTAIIAALMIIEYVVISDK